MKGNQTTYLVLGMLSIEPHRSGYDIRKAVESSVSYFWRESYGQIYPTLKRLVAGGLVVSRNATSPGGRERHEYSLTAKGGDCLKEWLAAPFHDDPPRNEFLLKLFFGRSAAPELCVQHIKTFQSANRNLLSTLLEVEKQANVQNADQPGLPFWLLTLSYGVAHIRASIAWSESALEQLDGPKGAIAVGSKKAVGSTTASAAKKGTPMSRSIGHVDRKARAQGGNR